MTGAPEPPRLPPQPGLLPGLVVLVCVGAAAALIVALTWQAAEPRIEQNRVLLEQRDLARVLPGIEFDNLLPEARIALSSEAASRAGVSSAWIARRGTQPVGVILRATATDGYSGAITMLVGLDPDGQVLGVRVVTHRETPGLGDAIEVERSDWIHQFAGTRLGAPPSERWRLRRDNGEFDSITGATISARAVTRAVHRALLYFEDHGEALLAPPVAEPPA
jgi:electron transport complex protein RnfG